MTIIEFSDFECPFCRLFAKRVAEARKEHANDVAHVFVHFPLSNHRFARPAARVAECAAAAGRFEAMHDLLFNKQDSLGLKDWDSFGEEAGIRDTRGFSKCANDDVTVRQIENGVAAGAKLGVRGKPTVIINGQLYSNFPADSLGAIVRRLIAGG